MGETTSENCLVTCVGRYAAIRGCPWVFVAIVTQLVAQPLTLKRQQRSTRLLDQFTALVLPPPHAALGLPTSAPLHSAVWFKIGDSGEGAGVSCREAGSSHHGLRDGCIRDLAA